MTRTVRSDSLRTLKALSLFAGKARALDVADFLGNTQQTVRKSLLRLSKAGLVDATMGDGAGVWYFKLTDAGREAIRQAELPPDPEDDWPKRDSEADVRQAIRTQPTSVFDLARVMHG